MVYTRNMRGSLLTGGLATCSLSVLIKLTLVAASPRMEPETGQVREGRIYTFTCSVTGDVPLVIFQREAINLCSLNRDGTAFRPSIPGFTCGRTTTDSPRYYVTVSRANRTYNNGDWGCMAGGQMSNRVSLEVLYGPEVTQFTANGKSTRFIASKGDDITLLCKVAAFPIGSVIIKRLDVEMMTQNKGNMTSVPMTSVGCSDTATYRCDAFNGNAASESLQLFVRCPPSRASGAQKPFYVAIEGQVTLSLSVLAYPMPNFTWHGPTGEAIQVNNGSVTDDSKFTDSVEISNVQQSDIGTYRVTVQNDVGNDTFTVTLKLKEGLSGGLLIGVIAGCTFIGIFVIIFICVIVRKLRKDKSDEDADLGMDLLERENKTNSNNLNPPDDVYTEVRKPEKTENNNPGKVINNTGAKEGRDEDGLMYVGVDVADTETGDVIKGADEPETQYAAVEINQTAPIYDNHPQSGQ